MFFHSREKGSVMALDVNTAEAPPTALSPSIAAWYPAVSPDGTRIAFGGFGPENAGLWILTLATGRAHRIMEGGFPMPAWSPDGTKLAADNRGAEGGTVWIIDLEKTDAAAD